MPAHAGEAELAATLAFFQSHCRSPSRSGHGLPAPMFLFTHCKATSQHNNTDTGRDVRPSGKEKIQEHFTSPWVWVRLHRRQLHQQRQDRPRQENRDGTSVGCPMLELLRRPPICFAAIRFTGSFRPPSTQQATSGRLIHRRSATRQRPFTKLQRSSSSFSEPFLLRHRKDSFVVIVNRTSPQSLARRIVSPPNNDLALAGLCSPSPC